MFCPEFLRRRERCDTACSVTTARERRSFWAYVRMRKRGSPIRGLQIKLVSHALERISDILFCLLCTLTYGHFEHAVPCSGLRRFLCSCALIVVTISESRISPFRARVKSIRSAVPLPTVPTKTTFRHKFAYFCRFRTLRGAPFSAESLSAQREIYAQRSAVDTVLG